MSSADISCASSRRWMASCSTATAKPRPKKASLTPFTSTSPRCALYFPRTRSHTADRAASLSGRVQPVPAAGGCAEAAGTPRKTPKRRAPQHQARSAALASCTARLHGAVTPRADACWCRGRGRVRSAAAVLPQDQRGPQASGRGRAGR
eukprot:3932035-Rhodomonas_salina.1